MSTDVATVATSIAALQAGSDYSDSFGKIAGPGFNFLPYLQLFTSNSDEVKRGTIGVACYGVIRGKEPPKDLGKTVLVMPLAWRAKAMDFRSGDKPVAYHKPQSEEFKSIRARQEADSNSGCMYGPEFLLWVEGEGYCTFFMGSKTARNAAASFRALLPKADGALRTGVISAQFIETKEYSWHGPLISASDRSFDPPPIETLMDTLTQFLSPVDSVKEEAAPAAAVNADR